MLNLFSLASRSAHWGKKELVAVMAFFLVCSRLMVSRGFGRKAVIFDLGTPWRCFITQWFDVSLTLDICFTMFFPHSSFPAGFALSIERLSTSAAIVILREGPDKVFLIGSTVTQSSSGS